MWRSSRQDRHGLRLVQPQRKHISTPGCEIECAGDELWALEAAAFTTFTLQTFFCYFRGSVHAYLHIFAGLSGKILFLQRALVWPRPQHES